MPNPPRDTIAILAALDDGDNSAWDELLPMVYGELKALAVKYWRNEGQAMTLQPTALVNEAYLRLVHEQRQDWTKRRHFFAAAARAMRQLLIEQSRARAAEKRGGGYQRVTLDDRFAVTNGGAVDLIALHEALEELAAEDTRQYQVVELRFFTGLSVEETASILGVSNTTVKDDWRFARAWLRRRLKTETDSPGS